MTRDGQDGSASTFRSASRRVIAMGLTWMLLGLMLGMVGGRGSGAIAFAAALTAGAIMLTPVGLLLAAFGSRSNESLVGGLFGMIIGVCTAMIGHSDPRDAAAVGLVTGALIGATVVTAFYRIPRLVFGKFNTRSQELPTAH